MLFIRSKKNDIAEPLALRLLNSGRPHFVFLSRRVFPLGPRILALSPSPVSTLVLGLTVHLPLFLFIRHITRVVAGVTHQSLA
jgi:hypothetical protein